MSSLNCEECLAKCHTDNWSEAPEWTHTSYHYASDHTRIGVCVCYASFLKQFSTEERVPYLSLGTRAFGFNDRSRPCGGARYSLNVPWILPECSVNVPWLFPDAWCLSTAVTGRHFGGWGRSGYSKECLKTTPDSDWNYFWGDVSPMKIHTVPPRASS